MMRMRTKLTGLSSMNANTTANSGGGNRSRPPNVGGGGGGGEGAPENWEMRPCGMLVQKRLDEDQITKPPPTIRVRVKYQSIYHEISINSQATFGELKKMLSGPTGLHHEDQKLYYKDKERDSKQFLDMVGVKDKSKMVLVEDPISQEKRYLEMRKTAKKEKAAESISLICLEVDRLAGQVSALESVISKGGRVVEKEVVNLIEQLMNELIKLDGIVADGDVKLQRKLLVKRVQTYVETLDMLKIKNTAPTTNENRQTSHNHQKNASGRVRNSVFTASGGKPPQGSQQQQRHSIGHLPLQPRSQQEQPSRHSASATVVTTQWETFESAPPLIPVSPSLYSGTATPKAAKPKFPWDIFD